MGITVTKQKVKDPEVKQEVEAVDVSELSAVDLADRYGSLKDKTEAIMMDPAFAQFSQVAKELAGRLAEFEPEDSIEVTGKHWMLAVGACSKKPRVLKDGAISTIISMLGMETFANIAKVTISDCEKYLNPDQLKKVIDADTGYTSNRKISTKFLG